MAREGWWQNTSVPEELIALTLLCILELQNPRIKNAQLVVLGGEGRAQDGSVDSASYGGHTG
jgi:hypothetical protein